MTTLSSYRAWAGISLDHHNAQLSAAVASGGTSLPITNINYVTTNPLVGSGASYTAFIVDGPNTEAVQLTGNLATGAVPCAALANDHSIFTYVVFILGTYNDLAPVAFMPLETFGFDDAYDQLYDTSNVGSMIRTRGAVQGKRSATFDMGGGVFIDTYPYVLGGIFGSEDVSGAGPYEHAFGTLNVALSGSTLAPGQPVRYIIWNFDANNTRLICGRFSESTLTIASKDLMKHASKFMGRASGVYAPSPTATFSATQGTLTPSWYAYGSIAGSVIGSILESETTFTRLEAEAIPTLQGNQDPYDIIVGALQIKGKFSLTFENDNQLNNYYNAVQPAFSIIGEGPANAVNQDGLTVQMSQCNYEKVVPKQQGKAYVTQDIEFEGLANTTDTTTAGGGNSYLGAGKVLVYNGTSGGSNYT
jgi:Phage tail tube protein